MPTWILVIGVLVLVFAPFAGLYLWVKVFNGPDGERLQKQRMQGPFVPLGAEVIEDDEERARDASSTARSAESRSGRRDV